VGHQAFAHILKRCSRHAGPRTVQQQRGMRGALQVRCCLLAQHCFDVSCVMRVPLRALPTGVLLCVRVCCPVLQHV
jgi:hypothetical protein